MMGEYLSLSYSSLVPWHRNISVLNGDNVEKYLSMSGLVGSAALKYHDYLKYNGTSSFSCSEFDVSVSPYNFCSFSLNILDEISEKGSPLPS